MKNDKMRAALDADKKYKVERVAEAEAAVRELQADIAAAEALLEAWRSMIPADVLRTMQEDSQREASNSAEAARATSVVAANSLKPNWAVKRTPTWAMASPLSWPMLVPFSRCAPYGAAYL